MLRALQTATSQLPFVLIQQQQDQPAANAKPAAAIVPQLPLVELVALHISLMPAVEGIPQEQPQSELERMC